MAADVIPFLQEHAGRVRAVAEGVHQHSAAAAICWGADFPQTTPTPSLPRLSLSELSVARSQEELGCQVVQEEPLHLQLAVSTLPPLVSLRSSFPSLFGPSVI